MRGPAMSPVSGGGGGGGLGINVGGGGGGDEERWRHFDNSINAISFGFVATAILISMFIVTAIFERFLRPRSTFFSDHDHRHGRTTSAAAEDIEAHPGNYARKLDYPKMSIYAKGVSVLMPGNDMPTFIAHPVPAPCPREHISWPSHQHIPIGGSTSISS